MTDTGFRDTTDSENARTRFVGVPEAFAGLGERVVAATRCSTAPAADRFIQRT